NSVQRGSSKIAFDYKPSTARSRSATHARWFASGLIVPLIGGLIAHTLMTREAEQPSAGTATSSRMLALPELPPIPVPELQPDPIPEPLGEAVEYVVRRNDTLARIFRQLKLNLADLAGIPGLPGVREKLDRLHAGDTI